MNKLKIGMVIADDMEYAPLENCGGEPFSYFGRKGHIFRFSNGNREIELVSVHCGIGKVNSATAAMYLIDNGCDIILNSGLSGGISNISRGELMLCTRYIEHDFDLTPLGFKKAQKPSQEYIYESDEALLSFFSERLGIKKCGMAVSGDCFVSDDVLRNSLAEEYGAMSCDMESAAIASVCHMTGKRFLSLRRISDDAGNTANSNYREMNENEKFDLVILLKESVGDMLGDDRFFN